MNLEPGMIRVSMCDPKMQLHMAAAWALKSPFIHVTIYEGNGIELSHGVQDGKPISAASFQRRPVTDRFGLALGFHDHELQNRVLQVANEAIGAPYDVLGFLFTGVGLVLGHPEWQGSRPTSGARLCSELVGDIIVKAGADPRPDVPDGMMLPEHFLDSALLYLAGFDQR